jgi:hypothetical protein
MRGVQRGGHGGGGDVRRLHGGWPREAAGRAAAGRGACGSGARGVRQRGAGRTSSKSTSVLSSKVVMTSSVPCRLTTPSYG